MISDICRDQNNNDNTDCCPCFCFCMETWFKMRSNVALHTIFDNIPVLCLRLVLPPSVKINNEFSARYYIKYVYMCGENSLYEHSISLNRKKCQTFELNFSEFCSDFTFTSGVCRHESKWPASCCRWHTTEVVKHNLCNDGWKFVSVRLKLSPTQDCLSMFTMCRLLYEPLSFSFHFFNVFLMCKYRMTSVILIVWPIRSPDTLFRLWL